MGSYLRTNYRITGKELDITAIGGGVPLSSWAAGAGTRREFGGFVMGSVATALASVYSLPATQVMASYYGETIAIGMDSGYKFVPIAFQLRIVGEDASTSIHAMWATLDGSAAMVHVGGSGYSVLQSTVTLNFVYAGFIVSSP